MQLLRITFPLEDVIPLRRPDDRADFLLVHHGKIAGELYHSEPVLLLSRPVPPHRIELVEEYDLDAELAGAGTAAR